MNMINHKIPSIEWNVDAMAVLSGFELAIQLGYSKVSIEGDSLTVIKLLEEDRMVLSPIGVIIHDIKSKLDDSRQVVFSHVKREANCVAHMLTRLACSYDDCLWLDKVPIAISSQIVLDGFIPS